MNLYPFRMRVARRVAPTPIMPDPFPGREGVMIVFRKDGFSSALAVNRFRLKSTTRLAPLDYEPGIDLAAYVRRPTYTRFVGTVGE